MSSPHNFPTNEKAAPSCSFSEYTVSPRFLLVFSSGFYLFRRISSISGHLWPVITASICFHVFLFGIWVRHFSHFIQLKRKNKSLWSFPLLIFFVDFSHVFSFMSQLISMRCWFFSITPNLFIFVEVFNHLGALPFCHLPFQNFILSVCHVSISCYTEVVAPLSSLFFLSVFTLLYLFLFYLQLFILFHSNIARTFSPLQKFLLPYFHLLLSFVLDKSWTSALQTM